MKSSLKLLLTGIVQPTLRLYREEFRRAPTKPALTFAQFRILNGIRRGRNQIGKLAEHHGISQPAMSKMVEGLVKKGLVKRSPHSTDRRQIELRLTPKAIAVVESVEDRVVERIAQSIEKRPLVEKDRIHDGIVLVSQLLADEDL